MIGPITFNRPDFITSSTDNYSSLDSEDDYRTDSRNVSHQQQFFSELHTPGRSHYTKYNATEKDLFLTTPSLKYYLSKILIPSNSPSLLSHNSIFLFNL